MSSSTSLPTNTLELWEGKNRGTGRIKIRSEQQAGQTRGYSIEEIAGISFDESSFVEYCEMKEWKPENIMDIAFISNREPKRIKCYKETFAKRGIQYIKSEFVPILVMKEVGTGLNIYDSVHWKGAFLHRKTNTIWFFQGFLAKPEELENIIRVHKRNVYYSDYYSTLTPYMILKNCSMMASKQFWIQLISRCKELLE
jgi:hypothetical protein